jgi:uncharacterized membrane protein
LEKWAFISRKLQDYPAKFITDTGYQEEVKMQPKTLIWISLALTVFVITAIAGVIFTVHNTTQADAASLTTNIATTTAAPDTTASTQEAQLVQVMNQREQAYQDTINQANARLDQAQKEIQSLQEQLQALQANPAIQADPAAQAGVQAAAPMISPQQAAQIAAQYMGHSDLYSVEGAPYNGAQVYKVTFSSGDVVIVDTTGQIVAVQPGPSQSAFNSGSTSSGSHEREHEHESGEGHDD